MSRITSLQVAVRIVGILVGILLVSMSIQLLNLHTQAAFQIQERNPAPRARGVAVAVDLVVEDSAVDSAVEEGDPRKNITAFNRTFACLPFLPRVSILSGTADHVPMRFGRYNMDPFGRDDVNRLAAPLFFDRMHASVDTRASSVEDADLIFLLYDPFRTAPFMPPSSNYPTSSLNALLRRRWGSLLADGAVRRKSFFFLTNDVGPCWGPLPWSDVLVVSHYRAEGCHPAARHLLVPPTTNSIIQKHALVR